eukprot:3352979-Prymnesium_polylepis.2
MCFNHSVTTTRHASTPRSRHSHARRHDRACGKLVSSMYEASTYHKYGLKAATSARSEHTAIGKPREGRRSK